MTWMWIQKTQISPGRGQRFSGRPAGGMKSLGRNYLILLILNRVADCLSGICWELGSLVGRDPQPEPKPAVDLKLETVLLVALCNLSNS